jgi:hypothetical protein
MSPRSQTLAGRAVLAALSLAALLLVAQPAQASTALPVRPGTPLSSMIDAKGVLHLPNGVVGYRRGADGVEPQAITAGTLSNQATGLCVDDSFNLNLRHEICYANSYTAGYQKWYFDWGNQNTIRNANTNRCLDDSPDQHLRSLTCTTYGHDEGYQVWNDWVLYNSQTWDYVGDAFSNWFTGWCLDDSSVGLRTFPCNYLAYQRFM